MPCGCGGSTQRASQTRRASNTRDRGDARSGVGPVSLNDPSLYWNGPKRSVEPTRGHTRRQG